MDELEQYQARIFAALDKVARITADGAAQDQTGGDQDDSLRQRDLALIEELEAMIAEERLDLDAERDAVAALKGKLVEADRALEDVQSAGSDHSAALQEVENALKDAETRQVEAQALASNAEASLGAATKAQQDAERELQKRDKQHETQLKISSHLEDKVSRLNARIENQDVQFQRLKAANAQLRDSNALLRERNVEQLGDASVIDQSMRAELEALKATRAADVDEMDTILEELKPLMEGQNNG
jgi:chromosome segregation ATPase